MHGLSLSHLSIQATHMRPFIVTILFLCLIVPASAQHAVSLPAGSSDRKAAVREGVTVTIATDYIWVDGRRVAETDAIATVAPAAIRNPTSPISALKDAIEQQSRQRPHINILGDRSVPYTVLFKTLFVAAWSKTAGAGLLVAAPNDPTGPFMIRINMPLPGSGAQNEPTDLLLRR